MVQFCLCWSVGLGVIVGLRLGQLWVSKFAVLTFVLNFPFGMLLRSGGVVLGMCFAMSLLYDTVVFALECWFGCDSWFGVGAAMGVQVCGLNICFQFPLQNFVEIWICCVVQVFC